MRARKSDEVLEAARRLFLDRGFDAATVDEIATEAGVSKATVYSNFHDKDALLVAMIDRITSESAAILSELATHRDDRGTTTDRLERMGRILVAGVLNTDVLRLRRLAVSSAVAFPGSAIQYWQRGPIAAIALIERQLEQLVESGELIAVDIPTTASQFAYALVGPLQDRAMFDISFVATGSEIDRYVENAVRQLLLASACAE